MDPLRQERARSDAELEHLGDDFVAASNPDEATLMYALAIDSCSNTLTRAKLRLKLGSLFSFLGAGEEAATQFNLAYDESLNKDVDLVARSLDKLAAQCWMNADTPNGLEAARKLRRCDASGSSAWIMGGYLQEARFVLALGDFKAALALIEEAEQLCDVTNVDLVASMLEVKGMASAKAGDVDSTVQLCESACDLASKRSDPHSLVFKLNNAAIAFRSVGLTTRALETHDRAVAEARRQRLGWRVAYTELSRATTLMMLGKFVEIREILERVKSEPKNLACRIGEVAMGLLVGVRTADDALLQEAYDPAALSWVLRSREPQRIGPTGAAFIEYYKYLGMDAEAEALLQECLEAISFTDNAERLLICAGLYGNEYQRLIARKKFSDHSKTSPHRAYMRLFDAICYKRSGNSLDADAAAGDAYAAFNRLGWRYLEAFALEVAGQHSDAKLLYEKLGAAFDLRRLRSTPRPVGRPRHWRGHLSEQQRKIAVLVARGARNDDVATTLGISTRTVKYHLTEIYHHFGIASRRELALHVGEDRSA